MLCLTGLMSSCFEDKGTDRGDYIALKEITIDTAQMGILSEYTVLQGEDVLEIAPDIYYGGELVTNTSTYPLDFCWTIYTSSTSSASNYRIDTLSTGSTLSSIINRGGGAYTLLLTVTENTTGVQNYCSFSITVVSSVSDGYLILYENGEGNTDAALLVNDWSQKNSTSDRVLMDLYSEVNGEALSGKPVSVVHSNRCLSTGEVLLASERDYVAVDKNTFEVTYPARALFYTPPTSLNVSFMGKSGSAGGGMINNEREYIISDNQIYITPEAMALTRPTAGKLGDPVVGSYGELAPWVSHLQTYRGYLAVLYDQTNTCFRYVASGGVQMLSFTDKPTTPFDITNTGLPMIASDWGRGTGVISVLYEYSLMGKGSEYALLVSNWSNTNVSSTNHAMAKYDMSSFPGISKAHTVAAGTLGPVFYYGTNDAVYLCNPDPAASVTLSAQQVWNAPAGEEITCVRVHKFNHNTLMAAFGTKNNEVLYVSTWNESTRTGTVYQIPMNPTSGVLATGEARVYTGFGKIKDMCWKWPPLG